MNVWMLCVYCPLLYTPLTFLKVFSPLFVLLWRYVLIWGTDNQVEDSFYLSLRVELRPFRLPYCFQVF